MRRCWPIFFGAAVLVSATVLWAQSTGDEEESNANAFIPTMAPPEFNARLAVGFNYDLLTSPTRVNFDYPRGYIGLNIPLRYGLEKLIPAGVSEDMNELFTVDGGADSVKAKEFTPTASAKQYANYTIRVDVPMMGGVASFSNIQNFSMNYTNTLGEPEMWFRPAIDSNVTLLLSGMVNVPLDISMGWETMTFAYAYQINKNIKFGLALHRNTFRFDLSAKIDFDLLGYLDVNLPRQSTGVGAADELIDDAVSQTEKLLYADIKYSSKDLYGTARAHYEVEVWTPTLALNLWRFGLTSRFGMDTRAPGALFARYSLPFFLDAETFQPMALDDPSQLMSTIGRFLNSEVDSISFISNNDMIWRMPQGHTLTFDIVREKLWVSYTKMFGRVEMELGGIRKVRTSQSGDDAAVDEEEVSFKLGVTVDHIIMLHGKFQNAFINLGIFSMDFNLDNKENLLEKVYPVTYGGGGMMPVLNFGTTFGAKLRLLLELDVLPFTALKTGIIYYF